MIDTTEAALADVRAILQRAYAGLLQCSAATLTAWRAGLSDSRLQQLAEFEARGLHPGLIISVPLGRPVVSVILTDVRGGLQVLETIETASGSLAVN